MLLVQQALTAQVVIDFLENVHQRGRQRGAGLYGKAQAVRLVGTVVRILPDNDHFDLVQWTRLERRPNVLGRRVNGMFALFGCHKLGQTRKGG